MSAVLSSELRLTSDQLRVLAARIGAEELPILAAGPHHTTVDRREGAFGRVTRELLSANLIVDATVHPDLVPILQALQRPDRELTMRLVSPEGGARISAVRRGTLCLLVRRIGDDILLRVFGHSNDFREIVSALLAELPRARPADIRPVAAPLQQMSASLSGTHDAYQLADRIRALGADSHAAMLLGTALASRQAFAEIVYSALAESAGRVCRGPGAVAVFYTKRGRIIGVPNASPSAELWTTIKPGSDHAVADAIDQLIALADQSWEPTNGGHS